MSDSIGETAEVVVRAAAAQYSAGHFEVRRFPLVDSPASVREVVLLAATEKSILVYTIVLPDLRRTLKEEAERQGVPAVDIMGPVLEAMEKVTPLPPKLQPGLLHRLDDEYFRRIEAVEFAVKYDDGKDARGVFRADVVLIGVSRTSKTPVSMYLAHRRIKVANIPLVPEVPIPEELDQVPPGKIVGLTVSPQQLLHIREERLKTIGLRADANYASLERILVELEYADSVFKRLRCSVIDATNKAVEETAIRVLEIIRKGPKHGDQ